MMKRLALIAGWIFFGGAAEGQPAVLTNMQDLYGAIEQVYPVAVTPGEISQPRHHRAVTEGLKRIIAQADDLRAHMGASNEKFDFNAYTMESVALQALEHYNNKKYEEAAYDIRRLTQSCVNCHSRQPAGPGQKKFKQLETSLQTIEMPATERARLFMATRQFDEAAKTLEKQVREDTYRFYEFHRDTAMLDYLILQVRVRSQPQQARNLLQEVLRKPELPVYFEEYLKAWSSSLKEIAADKKLQAATLAAAQRNIQAAETLTLYPMDRTALVYYLQASRVLELAIAERKLSKGDLAEAYWMLGSMEVLIGRNFWLSSAASYLEASIRTAPKSKAAAKAYRMLEEHIIIYAFTVRPEFLPTDTFHVKLEDLKKLMQASS